jgi:hypothetical protein
VDWCAEHDCCAEQFQRCAPAVHLKAELSAKQGRVLNYFFLSSQIEATAGQDTSRFVLQVWQLHACPRSLQCVLELTRRSTACGPSSASLTCLPATTETLSKASVASQAPAAMQPAAETASCGG